MAKDRDKRYDNATSALFALARVRDNLKGDATPWLQLLAQPVEQRRETPAQRQGNQGQYSDWVELKHALIL